MSSSSPIEIVRSPAPLDYAEAMATMDRYVEEVVAGTGAERLWLLEHPDVYTAGTSARAAHLLNPQDIPVFKTGRGGDYTYHGAGQRIGYAILDLKRRTPDVRCYVHTLEQWLINTLACFKITAERRTGRIGLWVMHRGEEKKIAALGVRLRKWVTAHGVALNVAPALEKFSGIVPCGIKEYGVTSLADLGVDVTMDDVDEVLVQEFHALFGKD